MSRSPWIGVIAVGMLLTLAFGTILYGFSIYVTDEAAGAEFSTSMLSLAYTGSVVVSGLMAAPLGRWMDRHGTRSVSAVGGLATCAGLLGFSLAGSAPILLASWWLLIGPGTAMVYYEPAYVVINQTIDSGRRPHALGILTVIGGFAGAIFIPLIEVMNSALGWRPTVRILGITIAALGLLTASLSSRRSAGAARQAAGEPVPFGAIVGDRRFTYLTIGMVLIGFTSTGLLAHRVDRFTEAGFSIETVAIFAGVASLISLPGRFVGPIVGGRRHGIEVLAWFLAVLFLATVLIVPDGPTWFMPVHFLSYGLAFGAVLPLRALAMDQWYGRSHYGRRMGIQQTATLVIGGLGPLGVGVLRDVTGDWLVPTTVLVLAAGAGLFFVVLARRQRSPSTVAG